MQADDQLSWVWLAKKAQDRRRTLRHLVNVLDDKDAVFLDKLLSQRKHRFDVLGNLPTELVLHVLEYLDLHEISLLAPVCQRWSHLSQAPDVVDYLHSKWLPLHDKNSANKYKDLSLVAAKAYMRATGCFPLRVSTVYHQKAEHIKNNPTPLRLECLQHDGTYRDIICTETSNANRDMDTRQLFEQELRRPCRVLYANGIVASYSEPLALLIGIHDLRRNKRRHLHVPSRFLLMGELLDLLALGNKFVVAASSRTICAWNFASGKMFHAKLPSRPICCVTHDDVVLVILSHGRLLRWEPSSRLTEVDTSLILDPRTLSCQDFQHPPLIIHPTERETFFAVTRSVTRPWPSVYEITSTGRGYAVSRTFTYTPPELSDSLDLSGHNSVRLEVRRVDSQGTFQLMNLDPRDTNEPRHHEYLMFNILSKSFSIQSYWNPLGKHTTRYGSMSGVSCVWGGQLISLSDQQFGSSQLLVAVDQRRLSPSPSISDGVQERFELHLRQSASHLSLNGDEGQIHVVRHEDIAAADPRAPDYHGIFGFQYACQAFPGACTYKGDVDNQDDHKPSCRSSNSPSSPGGKGALAFTKSDQNSRQDNERLESYRADYIYMDDDFMVIVAFDRYTAYCVDSISRDARAAMITARMACIKSRTRNTDGLELPEEEEMSTSNAGSSSRLRTQLGQQLLSFGL